jgi:biopolymer transport protein ExbB/TolQ
VDLMALGITLSKGVLIVFSFISVTVTVERLIHLVRSGLGEKRDYERMLAAAAKGDLASLRTTTLDTSSLSGRAVKQGLSAFGGSPDRLRDSVGRGISLQTAGLQKNLPLLATIASTAPYVGLFGTVIGILEAFRRIAATGETGPAIVSGSISEALVATALGLGVAIPAAIAYNLLLAKVNSLSLTVENHAMEIADALADQAPQEVSQP